MGSKDGCRTEVTGSQQISNGATGQEHEALPVPAFQTSFWGVNDSKCRAGPASCPGNTGPLPAGTSLPRGRRAAGGLRAGQRVPGRLGCGAVRRMYLERREQVPVLCPSALPPPSASIYSRSSQVGMHACQLGSVFRWFWSRNRLWDVQRPPPFPRSAPLGWSAPVSYRSYWVSPRCL